MKRLLITIMLVLSLLAIGCASDSSTPVLECTDPLIQKGEGCCLDADSNGACDVDEKKAVNETAVSNASVNQSQTEEKKETVKEEKSQENKSAEAPVLKGTKEDAEKVGEIFAERWQLKQYNTMYVMFTPELKQKKTASEFNAIMTLDPFYKKLTKVEFKGVAMTGEDTAELKLTVYNNVQKIEMQASYLRFTGGEWLVDVFADVFDLDTFDAACSGYRYSNQYKTSDCAFDLAKKTLNPLFCDKSECHYVECLKAVGAAAGMHEEAKQCFYCQPYGTTIVQCVLDIAIQYNSVGVCNDISEDNYSDRYCKCYGGFARHKKSSSYCNTIANQDYKDLCITGYEGKYC